jgi:hypothetical protein
MDVLSEYGSHIRSPKLIRLTRFSTPRAHRQCLRPRGFCLTSTNEKQKRGKKETVKTPYAVTSLQIRHRRLEVSSHFGPAKMRPLAAATFVATEASNLRLVDDEHSEQKSTKKVTHTLALIPKFFFDLYLSRLLLIVHRIVLRLILRG